MGSCNDVGLAGTRASMLLCMTITCPELANSTAWGLFLVFVFLLLFAMQYFLVVVNVQKGIFSTCHTCRDHCQLQEQHDDLLDLTAMHRLLLMMTDIKLAQCHIGQVCF